MGKRNVGIAMSDEKKKISIPLKVVSRSKEFYSELRNVLIDYNISGILVGIPLNDDETKNKMCQSIIDTSKNASTLISKTKNGVGDAWSLHKVRSYFKPINPIIIEIFAFFNFEIIKALL